MTAEQIAALTAWKLLGRISKLSQEQLELLGRSVFQLSISKEEAIDIRGEILRRAKVAARLEFRQQGISLKVTVGRTEGGHPIRRENPLAAKYYDLRRAFKRLSR